MKLRLLHWASKYLSKKHHQFPILERHQYRERRDISIYTFGDTETVSYTMPYHNGELHPVFEEILGTVNYPAPFILSIDNGKIYGQHALVTTADNHIIVESLFNHPPMLDHLSTGRIHFPKTVNQLWHQLTQTREFNTIFVIANFFGNSFYHWMIESLPRIWLLQQYQAQARSTIPLLVHTPLFPYVSTTLDLLKINHVTQWDATYGHAHTLLMPMALNGTGIPSPQVLRTMSKQLVDDIKDLPRFEYPRIYITRRQASQRRVTNEDEVTTLLNNYGFQSLSLEDFSLIEQIALFRQVEIAIGPHGAGFASAMHSQNLSIIEFFEPSYVNPCMYRLASGLSHKYGYLIGESQGKDITVSLGDLQLLLEKMNITK